MALVESKVLVVVEYEAFLVFFEVLGLELSEVLDGGTECMFR